MNYEILVDEVVKEVYKRLENTVQKGLLLIGSLPNDEMTLLKEEFHVQSFTPLLKTLSQDVNKILISELSLESLCGIALGCGFRAEESFILHSLLLNTPIYVLESGIEYRNYKNTTHKNLYRLYQDYEKKVLQYGIIQITSVTELLLPNLKGKTGRTSTEINYTKKNLLLEADLLKLKSQGLITLHVKKNCIITPSAADFIRNHNMKLNIIEEKE